MEKPASSIKPILIYVFLLFVVWTFRATVFYQVDRSIPAGFARWLFSTSVMFCLFALPVFLYLKFYDRCSPFKYLKLNTAPDKKGLVFGLVAAVLFFTAIVGLSIFPGGKNLNALVNADAPTFFYTLFRTAPASLFEEILFRGFFLNKFNEQLKFWQANLIQSLLFAAIHLPFWLFSRGPEFPILLDFTAVFILGDFLGFLLKKTNSLWVCVGAHIINNFWAGFLRFE